MKKIFRIIVFIFFVNASFAQNTTTAKIKIVATSGLHKLVLPVEIRSSSNEDLSNFRILDSKGIEVPYFYKNTHEDFKNSDIINYKIISKIIIHKKQTTIVFENAIRGINALILTIANYDGEKSYNLSGSNDQNQWYGLSNNNILDDLNSEKGLYIDKIISLPKNNYKFLKIELDDKKTLPINIESISTNNQITVPQNLLPVNYSNKQITELKSAKKTQIHIVFENTNFLDQINFDISNPKLYKRYATIYKIVIQKIKHKFVDQKVELTSFELNSNSQNTFNLSLLHEKEFYIEIENDDNQPLEIKEIQFFQFPVSVIADLKLHENYTIKTGNLNVLAPVYDISNFKNSISNNLPIAEISEIQTPKTINEVHIKKAFWEESWFLWVCISVAAIAILYFTSSLIKDMKKSEE